MDEITTLRQINDVCYYKSHSGLPQFLRDHGNLKLRPTLNHVIISIRRYAVANNLIDPENIFLIHSDRLLLRLFELPILFMSDIIVYLQNMLYCKEMKNSNELPNFYSKFYLHNLDHMLKIQILDISEDDNATAYRLISFDTDALAYLNHHDSIYVRNIVATADYNFVPRDIYRTNFRIKPTHWMFNLLPPHISREPTWISPFTMQCLLGDYLSDNPGNVKRYYIENFMSLCLEEIPVLYSRFQCKIISQRHLFYELGHEFMELNKVNLPEE